ncbi:hypothetical protein D3C75_862150 [compost metagenome]
MKTTFSTSPAVTEEKKVMTATKKAMASIIRLSMLRSGSAVINRMVTIHRSINPMRAASETREGEVRLMTVSSLSICHWAWPARRAYAFWYVS